MRSNMLLICEQLRFEFESNRPLFNDISFQLKMPGFFALFGPSGVGKTTLAQILAGILKEASSETLVRPSKTLYCYGNEKLPSWQSVGEHLLSVTPSSQLRTFDALAESFGLHRELLDAHPSEVSTGQHARLNVLRYLVQDFNFLILDESLSGVDEPTRLSVLGAIRSRFPEKSFLYISHQLLDAVLYSETILIMSRDNTGVSIKSTKGLGIRSDVSRDCDLLSDRIKTAANSIRKIVIHA